MQLQDSSTSTYQSTKSIWWCSTIDQTEGMYCNNKTGQSPDGSARTCDDNYLYINACTTQSNISLAYQALSGPVLLVCSKFIDMGNPAVHQLGTVCGYAPTELLGVFHLFRSLYEHYPRPKEFISLHRIEELLKKLLATQGRGSDAVHDEARQLLKAFNINVLF